MSTFAVMVFEDEKKAYEGLHALQQLHGEGSLTVWGADVVQRATDGKISVVKSDDAGPLGTGLGALTGGLLGLFGGPVGAAIGATAGAAAGAVGDIFHLGVTEEFLLGVERELAPGKFAVIADISEEWAELGAKVVREDRLAFAEDALEKRVNARRARLAQLKAEHVRQKAERAKERAGTKAEAMMQKLLAEEIEDERRKLEKIAEKSEKRLDSAKQELAAKVDALLVQASGAKPEVRTRIEQRIADVRNEFTEREQKLQRARELTQQALQP
jgi:uncharacterized membrane protein